MRTRKLKLFLILTMVATASTVQGYEALFVGNNEVASLEKMEVEVGKDDGCNLDPILQGEEFWYGAEGGREMAGTEIKFRVNPAQVTIINLQALTEPRSEERGKSFSNEASFFIPNGTKRYELKVFYVPRISGLISIDIEKSWINSRVWLKIIPSMKFLPNDVNWSGTIDRKDIRIILQKNWQRIRIEERGELPPEILQSDIAYWRCDINQDKVVDRQDLFLARKALGLNPGDYNDDGIVSILDQAYADSPPRSIKASPAPAKPKFLAISWTNVKVER